jgi:glycosyltransferase involved in cell wall biosynthesis
MGSDPGVLYDLLRALGMYSELDITALVNMVNIANPLPANIKLCPIEANFGGSLLENAMYTVRHYSKARKIIRSWSPDIVHHVTVAYDSSFSLLAIRGDIGKRPLVIGPASYNTPLPPNLAKDIRRMRWGRSWTDLWSGFGIAREDFLQTILSLSTPFRSQLFKKTIERSNVVIVVNEFTRRAYSTIVSSKRIKVIPLGVDTSRFAYSTPPKGKDILALGGLYERKGFQFLISAMPRVVREYPNTKLHIVGDGPLRGNLQELAKRAGVSENTIFHGFVSSSKLPFMYRASRIVCLPTLHESFGLVLLEGMSSGRAVISTESVGPQGIISNGHSGIIVPIADTEAIGEALLKLLDDYDMCLKMGLNGRKIAEETYDWKVIGRMYYDTYRKLC